MVVSNIFYVHPYLGKIPILTNIFQRDGNHQPEDLTGTLVESTNPKKIGVLDFLPSTVSVRNEVVFKEGVIFETWGSDSI